MEAAGGTREEEGARISAGNPCGEGSAAVFGAEREVKFLGHVTVMEVALGRKSACGRWDFLWMLDTVGDVEFFAE